MRCLFGILLTIQFTLSPALAGLGEKSETSLIKITNQQLAAEFSRSFIEDAYQEMDKLNALGLAQYISQSVHLNQADKKFMIAELAALNGEKTPSFKQSSSGQWEIKIGNNLVTYSLTDIYLQQLIINGQLLSYKGQPLAEIKSKIKSLLKERKTSFSDKLINELIITDAYAMEPISAVAIVAIAAIVLGTAVYYMHFKPKKAVDKIKATANSLKQKADSCENAGTTRENYDATYELAGSLSERTVLNSATSAENALQLHIKNQIEKGIQTNTSEGNCGQAVSDGLRSIGMDVPNAVDLNKSQMRREALGRALEAENPSDISGAIMGLCSTYNKLVSCMSQFVKIHTNDTRLDSFKDDSEYNFSRFRTRAGTLGQ